MEMTETVQGTRGRVGHGEQGARGLAWRWAQVHGVGRGDGCRLRCWVLGDSGMEMGSGCMGSVMEMEAGHMGLAMENGALDTRVFRCGDGHRLGCTGVGHGDDWRLGHTGSSLEAGTEWGAGHGGFRHGDG